MELIPADCFLDWARASGIVLDPRYAPPKCLVYEPNCVESRWWDVPGETQDISRFVRHLLAGIGPWSSCRLWRRAGQWENVTPPHDRLTEIRQMLIQGPAIPAGFKGAVKYTNEEMDPIVGQLTAHIRSGWCVDDDLFVIPDTGRCIVQTDHHGVVHVSARDGDFTHRLAAHMVSGGYSLPDELLDWTFKRPEWMKGR